MTQLKALLIGQGCELMVFMPSLLVRAGFSVEAITVNPLLKKSKFISRCLITPKSNQLITEAAKSNLDAYNFIIICDDITLKEVLEADLAIEIKLKLLPVTGTGNLNHLYSKIGLSQTLLAAGISTPPFAVITNYQEAISEAQKLGYPVMVKIDASHGGAGVFECNKEEDFKLIDFNHFKLPLLIQKKIKGVELDLSALYRDEKLIHFSYSKVEKIIGSFGPSRLRTYEQLGNIENSLFQEMIKLGKALGANGFANISCIQETESGQRYFIEADMRPNVWAEYSKFIGDDPAVRISKWFLEGESLQYPQVINKNYPLKLLLPYFLRLSRKELFYNHYNVWKYIPQRDKRLMLALLYKKVRSS